MPTFQYTARNSSGAEVNGRLQAANRKLALRQLSLDRLTPIRLVQRQETGSAGPGWRAFLPAEWQKFAPERKSNTPKRLPASLALPFLRALAEMLGSGIQAGDAIRLLQRRSHDIRLRTLCGRLWEDISQGQPLSEAMRQYAGVFDETTCNLVEAGEATGNLQEICQRLVMTLEEQKEIRAKLGAALAYPIFIVLMAFGVILIFLFYLLPKIESLLESLGDNLPWSTRVLIGTSEFAINFGWLVAVVLFAGAMALWSWRKTVPGRRFLDGFSLRLPGLGPFLRDSEILRITQTLSLLLENGITTLQALNITERVVKNVVMRRKFSEARNRIAEGSALSSAFQGTGYFNALILDIFTVGESTGNVVPSLKEMARNYSTLLEKQTRVFIGVLSIAVLLLAFAFVALVIFGIISSVFQLSSSLSLR